MYLLLPFLVALVASVSCIPPRPSAPENFYFDPIGVPDEEYPGEEISPTGVSHVSIEVTIDLGGLALNGSGLAAEGFVTVEPASGSTSGPLSTNLQLLAAAAIALLLAALIALEVHALQLKRQARAGNVVHVKDTI